MSISDTDKAVLNIYKDTDLVLVEGENGAGKSSILKSLSISPRGYFNTVPVGKDGGSIEIEFFSPTKGKYKLSNTYKPKKKSDKFTVASILSKYDPEIDTFITLTNEYVLSDNIGARTEWIITMPTRQYHIDYLYLNDRQ